MNDFVELRHYTMIVLKRWWVMVLAVGLTMGIGYVYITQQQPIYKATASILVGQSIQGTNLSSSEFRISEQLAETYAALAQRQPILEGTVAALDLDMHWRQLRGMVSAKIVGTTQLVEITAEASSPTLAVSIADEVAKQLILISPTALQNQESAETVAFVEQQLQSLQFKIENGQLRIDELASTDISEMAADEVAQLQREIEAMDELITGWEGNYVQLLNFVNGTRSANYLAIVDTGQASSKPVRPNVQIVMAVSAAIGLALGFTLAFILEHRDDTVKSSDDLGEQIGLSFLGAIREIKSQGIGYERALIASRERFSPESEAYRMIRSNIQFITNNGSANGAVRGEGKSILVTSAIRGEGKSSTVANLGVVMAQANFTALIVDTDLRCPVQHEIFKLPNERGLTNVLRQPNLNVADFLHATQVPGLQVLTCGPIPPNPSELLGSQRMQQIMEEMAEMVDVVIYDSPPAVVVTDAAILSERTDGTVLVVEVGKTRRNVARLAIKNLQQAGAQLYGVVLNRVSRKTHSYYYHSYNYEQSHYQQGQVAE